MPGKVSIEALRDMGLLACSICMLPYNEDENLPMSLPCGHTFCNMCVLKLPVKTCVSNHSSEGEACGLECSNKECPECATPFASTALRKNVELIRSVRLLLTASLPPAKKKSTIPESEAPLCQICRDEPCTVVCTQCTQNKNLCEGCFSFSHSKAKMQSHISVPWAPNLTNQLCAEHGHECLIYCRQDRALICTLCTFGRHKGHDIVVTSEEVADSKQRVRDIVAEVETLTRTVQTGAEAVSTRFEEITGRSPMDTSKKGGDTQRGGTSVAVIEVINRRFDELRDLLEARRRELIEQVRVLSDEKSALLTEQLDASSIYVARNYSVCYDVKQTIENKSSAFVLEHEADMIAALDRQKELFDSVSLVPCTSRDIRFVEPTFDNTLISGLGSVLSVDVDTSRCLLAYEGIRRIRAGETADCTLELFDRHGERIRVGGNDVSCLIIAQSTGDVVEEAVAGVSDNNDGTYGIHCAVAIAGDYLLRVSVDGVTVTCSSLEFSAFDIAVGPSLRIGDGQLKHPRGICYADGLFYVCDSGNHRIQVFLEDGTFVRSIGNGCGKGNGQLNNPRGICHEGELLFVSDSGNHRVQVFREDGTFVRTIGEGKGTRAGQFRYPSGICHVDGLLYVSDSGNNRVQVFREGGMYVGHIGQGKGEGRGQMRNPSGLCSHQGILYICDKDNNRIQAFNQDGTFINSSEAGLVKSPNDICVINDEFLCICGEASYAKVFTSGGEYVRSLSLPEDTEGGVSPPNEPKAGVCVGPAGLVYLTSSGDHGVVGMPC